MGQSQSFNVVPLREGALPPVGEDVRKEFMAVVAEFQQDLAATGSVLTSSREKIKVMKKAMVSLDHIPAGLLENVYEAEKKLMNIDRLFSGHPAKAEVRELDDPTPSNRMFVGFRGMMNTYGPTQMHRETVQAGKMELQNIKSMLQPLVDKEIPALEKAFSDAGAPWMEGQGLIRQE